MANQGAASADCSANIRIAPPGAISTITHNVFMPMVWETTDAAANALILEPRGGLCCLEKGSWALSNSSIVHHLVQKP